MLEYAQNHAEQFREYAGRLGAPTLVVLRGAATSVAGIVTIFVLAYPMVLEAPKVVSHCSTTAGPSGSVGSAMTAPRRSPATSPGVC
ncbi:hypothetical protein [Paractinoplanes maris]|uniref:hypothetical protein n=1 Tax=Paractinoplanes maris TaxID=1734446 RepID=UPI00202176EA|nr:hypothetical protein [Actinoplanes maris]